MSPNSGSHAHNSNFMFVAQRKLVGMIILGLTNEAMDYLAVFNIITARFDISVDTVDRYVLSPSVIFFRTLNYDCV